MYAAEMLNVLDLGREIKSIAISIASLEEGFYILHLFIIAVVTQMVMKNKELCWLGLDSS